MKYGLIVDFGAPCSNFGDYVQSVAIEFLYQEMGIAQSQIVNITQAELSAYDGEQLLLPYSYVLHLFVFPGYGAVRLSPKITPVFLGGSFSFTQFGGRYPLDKVADEQNGWFAMFRRAAPIGCRDEFTRKFLADHGIAAYLQGCITNIFPRRANGCYKKTLLVDLANDALPHIPGEILENAEILSNYAPNYELTVQENYRRVKERYDYYRDNAALVVTSRYHVALPCNAMGIPCIFIERKVNYYSKDIRLDSLHPYIQFVSGDDYSGVDWHPQWRDFHELKASIVALSAARIREAYTRFMETGRIRRFFQPRIDEWLLADAGEAVYKTRLRKFVRKHHDNAAGRFYIWGAIKLLCDGDGVVLANIVRDVNPNLQFAGWIDTFKTGLLAQRPIFHPDDFTLADNEFVVVAAETAAAAALGRFRQMGLNSAQYLILANTMVGQRDLEDEKIRRGIL
ncbi:MAG: polysaccharide pyruvyl transferase family protein [Acidaminococcales bacterium]|jgi:hypothetical protein|nr:polysaccharide pyruvyl transferase family protein [Acidaminococcales bacterium]